jgi:hypothetical protein
MRIRFLQTTPSMNPTFPFQAGQIIEVPKLTAEMRGWLANGSAHLLKDEPETAVVGTGPEHATLPPAKARP